MRTAQPWGTPRLTIADKPSPFVAPKLSVAANEVFETEIIYIEAAAAVGKSTIARYLSSVVGVPILDLSKIPVSTGSLHTLLLELRDKTNTTQIEAFHAGNCPIIIDAIDEGRLLSGETGIEHFLITTAELLQANRTNISIPKVVIFGRYESIETAKQWIELTAPEIHHTRIQIGFFDKDAAWELIEAYAELIAKSTPGSQYLQHKVPARQVIGAYFDAIAKALGLVPEELWQREHGKAFAGYAPVLSAVGTLIAVINNYIEAANRLTASGGQAAWEVMETVIDEILKREQEKLKTPLRGQCKTALPDSVYDKREQLALVAQYIDGRPLEGAKRVDLPPSDMAKYQDVIQRQLTEHPFVRLREFSNAVFGSVVLAHAICNGQSVSSERLISLSRQPFIWREISRLLTTPSLLDGNLVGYILDSFWSDQLTRAALPIVYMRSASKNSVGSRDRRFGRRAGGRAGHFSPLASLT
jgi:hypothetical protein